MGGWGSWHISEFCTRTHKGILFLRFLLKLTLDIIFTLPLEVQNNNKRHSLRVLLLRSWENPPLITPIWVFRGRQRWRIGGARLTTMLGSRQRSGEAVVRRNGCPKGCFWRVSFFSAPLRLALKTPENLKGAEKRRTLQKHPFGQPFLRTTPSLLPWRALKCVQERKRT